MPARHWRSIGARSIPLVAAVSLSVSVYAAHSYTSPLLAEAALPIPTPSTSTTATKKNRLQVPANVSPYTPLVWGTNRYLTLFSDPSVSVVKKPTPILRLGSTPLRDVVIAEKYAACVDARGDCWMWGVGYDPSGEIGRSLKGKNIKTLVPAAAKLVALSSDGKIYLLPVDKSFQDAQFFQKERSWWNWIFGRNPGVDFVQLQPEGGLGWGEHWSQVAAGTYHVLALTNKGRTFSIPLSPAGNLNRQLGTRQTVEETYPITSPAELALAPKLPPDSDIRFATKLTEIPALKDIKVAQVAASDRTSFIRTADGRVVGWGANEYGQIGLGANAAVDTIAVPVEVVLAKGYPGATRIKCTNITAAGLMTFYTVERQIPGQQAAVDVLACGNGVSGALGNGLWTNACVVPTRVKTISGLQESHVFATLDTVAQADEKGTKHGLYGKDVMVWGGNMDYQLGNGKRSSLAIPQHLPALIQKPTDALTSEKAEAALSSGTRTPMPHSRLQLHESRADAYDLDGKLIKRKVKCEETVVAGWNASVMYNKII